MLHTNIANPFMGSIGTMGPLSDETTKAINDLNMAKMRSQWEIEAKIIQVLLSDKVSCPITIASHISRITSQYVSSNTSGVPMGFNPYMTMMPQSMQANYPMNSPLAAQANMYAQPAYVGGTVVDSVNYTTDSGVARTITSYRRDGVGVERIEDNNLIGSPMVYIPWCETDDDDGRVNKIILVPNGPEALAFHSEEVCEIVFNQYLKIHGLENRQAVLKWELAKAYDKTIMQIETTPDATPNDVNNFNLVAAVTQPVEVWE